MKYRGILFFLHIIHSWWKDRCRWSHNVRIKFKETKIAKYKMRKPSSIIASQNGKVAVVVSVCVVPYVVAVLLVTLINTKGKSDSCKREVFRSRSSAVLLINWLENVNIFALALVKMGHVLFHSVSHTVSSINFNKQIKLISMFQRLKFTINHGRSSTLPHYWRYNPMEHSSQWWTSREKV